MMLFLPTTNNATMQESHYDEKCGWRCGDECFTYKLICDGYPACDDDSDEGKEPHQGCNLFPDSGCLSYEGKRHYKCARSGECFKTMSEAERCEKSTGPPVRECNGEGDMWRCGDGRCVEKYQVCDGVEHCEDGSDEGREPYHGCNTYPHNPGDCYSWGGESYSMCLGMKGVCTTLEFAQEANSTGNVADCRKCPEMGGWRCNDGRCIKDSEYRNGIPDCDDESDEAKLEIEWFLIFVSTVIMVSVGLSISFLCRLLNRKNMKNFFHCSFCSSSRRLKVQQYNPSSARNRGEMVDSKSEEDMLFPNDDIPSDLINILEDSTNWEVKKKGRFMRHMTGSLFSTSALKSQVILEAKRKYVLVHNDSVRYYHLYMYFANRCSTVKELAKVTNHLFSWEKEMHCHNKLEVIKCWRLHLGCSSLTSKIINSVSDEPSFYSRCGTTLYPLRQCLRSLRRSLMKAKPKEDSTPHKIITLIYFSLLPFVGASLFYFELIKNFVFVHIFWCSLVDVSRDKPLDHPFEFSLVLFSILALFTTQMLFLFYSYYYAEDIFEVAHDEECQKIPWKIMLCKILSVVLAPILPCYVLANHVYYEAKMSRTRRHLQTFTESHEAPISDAEYQLKERTQKERIKLYKNTCQLETKSLLYRKLYSYYRVTSAVIDSLTIIVVLILLMFVTGRSNRDINLIDGVEHRLAAFFGISTAKGGTLVTELNIVRDVVISGSLMYSMSIVLTALVKYWYQAKNLAISWMGQTILGLYMGFLTINKLTTAISIFSNTQLTNNAEETDKPNISLPLAIFLFIVLVFVRLALVYFYKRRFSISVRAGSYVDHWINVMVNTLVIIPFVVQTEPLRELKEKEKEFFFSPEKMQQKREELKRKTQLLKIVNEVDTHGVEREVVESVAGLVMPNMNFFTGPLLYDDFRAEIIQLWWQNPSQKLELGTVKKHLLGKNSNMRNRLLSLKVEEVDQNIRVTLEHLEYIGLVNTPLLNTAPTKREYFWLLLLVLFENIVAVCIEFASGGVKTKEHKYYSWDVRLASFAMALFFLLAYYKKYHMTRDLTSTGLCVGWISNIPVCLCCKKDSWLAAPPNEDAMQEIISQDETDRKKRTARSLQTQTSFTPYSFFPPDISTTSTMTSNLNQSMEIKTMQTVVSVPQDRVQMRTIRESEV